MNSDLDMTIPLRINVNCAMIRVLSHRTEIWWEKGAFRVVQSTATKPEAPQAPPTTPTEPTEPNGTPDTETLPEPPVMALPSGFVLLSKAAGPRERKNDPYKDLRAVVGRYLVIESVDQVDVPEGGPEGAIILTVHPVMVQAIDGQEPALLRDGDSFKVPAPKASVTMLKRAQERGVTETLVVYVQETKRGIALR